MKVFLYLCFSLEQGKEYYIEGLHRSQTDLGYISIAVSRLISYCVISVTFCVKQFGNFKHCFSMQKYAETFCAFPFLKLCVNDVFYAPYTHIYVELYVILGEFVLNNA